MKIGQGILSAMLVASAAIGVMILATDRWLWFEAPSHADGLIAFVVVDFAVTGTIWIKTRLGILGAMLVAAVQLVAMLSDIFAGQPTRVPSSAFRSYLLANTAYVSLLLTQSVILLLAVGTLAFPLLHGHKMAFLRARNN